MRIFSKMDVLLRNSVVGGLVPNISPEDIQKRFSLNNKIEIKAVDVIRNEKGQCKGFAYVFIYSLIL